MKLKDCTIKEIQRMRFCIKNPKVLATYFEGSVAETATEIARITKPPVKYVKEMDSAVLLYGILLRGYRNQAKKLGVSTAFLKTHVKDNVIDVHFNSAEMKDMFNPIPKEKLEDLSERIPFMTLLEAVSGWTRSQLKLNINVPKLLEDANLTTSKGRKAELIYKHLRGDAIEVDMNETDPQAGFDFQDADYGKVDVKSASPRNTKRKGIKYYFTIKDTETPDYFALIGMDEDFVDPVFLFMVPASTVPKNVIISEDQIEKFRAGDWQWIRHL